MNRPIRVLIAKLGLDGHDRGARVVAAALRDAGMEVIYTGLRKSAEAVAEAALEEDVDVVGVSILSGAHLTLVPKLYQALVDREMGHLMLVVGGVIPDADVVQLKETGVDQVFSPGTSLESIVSYITSHHKSRQSYDAV